MDDQITEKNGVVYHESAGGFVFTANTHSLMVALLVTHEGLGIPKGHIHQNETTEEAAIREVKEETGIKGKLQSLGKTSVVEYEFSKENDPRKHKKRLHLFTFLVPRLQPLKSEENSEVAAVVGWVDAVTAKGFLIYQQNDYEIAYQEAIDAVNQ